MVTVTISKKEYEDLMDAKLRYEYLRQTMRENVFAPPPTRNRKEILKQFKTTKKYNKKFLESLERGLRRSTYFRA